MLWYYAALTGKENMRMAQCYIELRKSTAKGTDSLAADIMRHLHTRQHLGKAIVVCDQPVGLLSAARKQWLKLSRALQRQRASTLNADKILKYTHAITRMQHMGFSAKTPLHNPEASVYFLQADDLRVVPVFCYTVYILVPMSDDAAHSLVAQLPADALVIDYTANLTWRHQLGLIPKIALEQRVEQVWHEVLTFLADHGIAIDILDANGMHSVEAMDNVLDTLLGKSRPFLRIAEDFQRALELARPLEIAKDQRALYDAFILLAHRVQALSPGSSFGQQFLEAYNEDDTFFLYDAARGRFVGAGETLAEAYARHMAAGRVHLAQALMLPR